jgi:hypothetical protein
MRIMIACLAAVAAVAFAAPSFAQDATPAPTPTPIAKPKVGTAAYCNSLKTTSSKTACLKRLQASAAKPAAPTTTAHKAKAKKPATDTVAPKETSALAPPPPAAAAPSKPVQQAQPSTIIVPPLPQKTI